MKEQNATNEDIEVSSDIITLPNVISFIRLCLIPLYAYLLMSGYKIAALVVFATSSATDFLDGYLARKLNKVSRLGQLMDPAIDTLLMISGVLGSWAFCGLPTWVMALIFAREALILLGGIYLIVAHQIRIPVVYAGKVATASLFVGICVMFLASWGIWIVYAGLALQIGVTVYYAYKAALALSDKKNKSI